jgi:hypothetical protein
VNLELGQLDGRHGVVDDRHELARYLNTPLNPATDAASSQPAKVNPKQRSHSPTADDHGPT